MSEQELSPAQRYAAAKQRAQVSTGELGAFTAQLTFGLDDFQVQACVAVERGDGVLVAAPTGAGKTVVGEFAVHLAIQRGQKAFYTTPIKALSNQKYADFVERYGHANVGLLTGDTSINGEAPVVVMTTEVLRNMLYASSPTLEGLRYVVMDEVHYLADRFRGPVWEEVIIHLPLDVCVVSLSATVSNAEEFGDWLREVRGSTEVIVSEHRPVPLFQHVMVGRRLVDLFSDTGPDQKHAKVNPELQRLADDENRRFRTGPGDRGYRGGGGRSRSRERVGRRGYRDSGSGSDRASAADRGRAPAVRHTGARRADANPGTGFRPPRRADVIERLDANGLLPAITFIFSRAGCDAAVRQCLASGVRLTTPEERGRIREVYERGVADISHTDLAVLGFDEWREGLERGLAAHHAGLIPAFKVVVEDLFKAGLVKAVFATETLALGINMPARSVVLEKLVKFNGESHLAVTPGEYTQLTGRAGRRGIDVEGHAVVVWQQGMDPQAVAGLASTRTYPLKSSFRPTYNMSVNLVAQVGRQAARDILETSFAQFQADRGVVGLTRQFREQDEALAGYREAMVCHLGDFAEYHALRQQISSIEKEDGRRAARARKADAVASLGQLSRGDVIRVPSGRRAGFALVVDPGKAPGLDGPRPVLLTMDAQVRRVTASDLNGPVESIGRLRIPSDADTRRPKSRRDLASSMRNFLAEGRRAAAPVEEGPPEADQSAASTNRQITGLRAQLRAHPCHGCADREDHDRWANRADELERRRAGIARQIEGRTNSIATAFERVCDLLLELGYLVPGDDGEPRLSPSGSLLRQIYSEKDLLVAECLRRGAWSGLDGVGLACVAAAVVYEARREEVGAPAHLPGGGVREAVDKTVRHWSRLTDREDELHIPATPRLDFGLITPMHQWVRGAGLEQVLEDGDLTAGDFVRWSRQTLDLLSQIALVADRSVSRAAHQAVALIDRGVVAVASV